MPLCADRFRARWLGLLVLLGGGCGVTDYEAKMLIAQNRMQRYEEEAKLLGPPLVRPTTKNKEGTKFPIANIFIRPPRGISEKPDNEDEPRGGLLYTYSRSKKDTNPVTKVELAVGNQKEFANDVLGKFAKGQTTNRQRPVRPAGREGTITFNTTEFEDDVYFYSVNIWGSDKTQVAIVYQIIKSQRAAVVKAIDMSLETFAMNQDATQQRELYSKGSPMQVPDHPGR